jgi:hypothetical protein
VLRVARRRYRSDAQLRLRREDLVALGLDKHRADLLSQVLLRGAPFVGGGGLDPADWEREIRGDGLKPFLEVETVDDYFRAYAQLFPARHAPLVPEAAPIETGGVPRQPALGIFIAVFGLGVATVAALPIDHWIGVAAVLGLAASPMVWPTRIVRWPPNPVGLMCAVALAALFGLAAMATEQHFQTHPDQPEHYIVHISEADVLSTSIRPDGAKSGKPPLVNGEDVFVVCRIRDPRGLLWDQLTDGTFTLDRYLVEVAGAPTPPSC